MRYAIAASIFLACISADVSAQTYGLDNTNPEVFSKFRIPKTDLSALWFNTNFNYNSSKNSTVYPVGPNYNYLTTNLSYSLSPQYYFLKESDQDYLSVRANASGSYLYSYSGSEGPGIPRNNYYSTKGNSLNVHASETYREYLQAGDVFYSIGSMAQLLVSSNYDNNPLPDSTRNTIYNGMKTQNYRFSLGIGWGKMRNVTSVVSAIRFQERMKQLNLINLDLSEKAIEDLAQEFYREGYYSSVHVRPDKFFWQDVQNTLSADGVSLNGLNQYADSYLREVPNELRFMRNEGIVGGISLAINYSNTYGSARVYPAGISEQLMALGNVYLDFSHQLNLNSQFSFDVSLSGGPNLTANPQVRQQYNVGTGFGYDYELTDRIVASVNESFSIIFQNAAMHQRNLTNSANVSVNYFVEDNVSLAATYSWNYWDTRGLNSTVVNYTESDNYVNIGLTYYIDRGFLYK